MMSLDQVRSFIAVAEELHFGRAAERLKLTQPPLSRQIQKLERIVGAPLLIRGNRAVHLTPAGEAFLVEARRLVALAELAPQTARRAASGDAGRLALGFTATVALGMLGPLLRELDQVMPHVDVLLSEQVSALQIEGLQSGRLDLGLVRIPPDSEEYSSRLVHRERMLVAVPASSPLGTAGTAVEVEELEGLDMISYSPADSKYFDDLVTTLLANVHTRSTQRVTQVHSMLALVSAERGVAIVPSSAASFHMDNVVLLPLRGWDSQVAELRAVWRKGSQDPVLMRALDRVASLQPLG